MKNGRATFCVSYFIGSALLVSGIRLSHGSGSTGRVGRPALGVDGIGPLEEVDQCRHLFVIDLEVGHLSTVRCTGGLGAHPGRQRHASPFGVLVAAVAGPDVARSEEHTSEL